MRWLEILAVGLYTFDQTQSAFMVALMYFARTCPTLVCGPLAGTLAERVPRKRLYCTGLAAMSVVAGTLSYLAHSGALELWQVAIGAVISGVVWSLEHTTRRTIARDVVGSGSVGNAISLDTGSQNSTRMIGPLAGGALMAIIGIEGAYTLSCIFFVMAMLLCLTLSRSFPAAVSRGTSMLSGMIDVIRHAARHPSLSAVIVVTVVMNLLGFPYVSMVPVIAGEEMGLDASQTGVLMAAEGAGAVLGALVLAFSVKRRHYARIFSGGSVLFIVFVQVFALLDGFLVGVTVLFIAGIGLGGFAAMQSTILLTFAPPEMRARVMGLLVLAIGSGPLGVLLLGSLAEGVGASVAISVTAGCGFILLCASLVRWPVLLRPTE